MGNTCRSSKEADASSSEVCAAQKAGTGTRPKEEESREEKGDAGVWAFEPMRVPKLSSQERASMEEEWRLLEGVNHQEVAQLDSKAAGPIVKELRGKRVVAIVRGGKREQGVHDGDTVKVLFRHGGEVLKHNLRFARLDTPEVSKESEVHKECGRHVRQIILRVLKQEKFRIWIQVPDTRPDRWNRLLSDIFLGLDRPWCLNDWMMQHRIAKPYHDRRSEWTASELGLAQSACERGLCPPFSSLAISFSEQGRAKGQATKAAQATQATKAAKATKTAAANTQPNVFVF